MFNPYLVGLQRRLSLSNDIAVVDCKSDRYVTSTELWRGSQRAARALAKRGVSDRDHVVVTLIPNERYCQIIYGLFLLGAIPVFLDPATSPARLNECITELSPKLWISDSISDRNTAIHVDNFVFDDDSCSSLADLEPRDLKSDETCLMIYTSGTTGLPKGVPWTCENIASYLDAQNSSYKKYNIKTEFALFAHLAISSISIGRRCVLPDLNDFQPARIDIEASVQQMTTYGCDYMFASPTYWRRLIAYCSKNGITIPGAKIIATAGASVNCQILERSSEAFPNALMHIPYASTEVLMPISTIDLSELSHLTKLGTSQGRGIPIGCPASDMRVEVIPSHFADPTLTENSLLSAGEIGELIVSGPRVTAKYFKRPQLTREAKITNCSTAQGGLSMRGLHRRAGITFPRQARDVEHGAGIWS